MPEDKILAGLEAFNRYNQGKDAWNAWASEHRGWKVDFSGSDFPEEGDIDFCDYIFPGEVSFAHATFGKGGKYFNRAIFGNGMVSFYNAKFNQGNVYFLETRFGGESVLFTKAEFGEGIVSFTNAKIACLLASFVEAQFEGRADFSNLQFEGTRADFGHACFGKFANFEQSRFSAEDLRFSGVLFRGEGANFDGATFNGTGFDQQNVSFAHAHFETGCASFRGAHFVDISVDFRRTIFGCPVDFTDAEFDDFAVADFSVSEFKDSLTLDKTIFRSPPDFRHSKLERDISMIGTEVVYQREPYLGVLTRSASEKDSSKYRKLKSMGIEAKDHDRELEFFSYEQRAKYAHHLSALQYSPILLYHFFSNFGRSIWRPIIGIISTWFFFAQLFFWRSFANSGGDYCDALKLSASQLFPFISWSRESRKNNMDALYKYDVNDVTVESIHWIVEAGIYLESIVAAVFLFLIGLALRNRLRV